MVWQKPIIHDIPAEKPDGFFFLLRNKKEDRFIF
jgi:hypothetical protein